MLTKKVTDDDNFMSLSSSAQALYLHLSMNADDDGFCNQVSVSMFKAHASVQDLEALLEKRYLYQFENGVIVIKHWRMANALRKDRYTPTVFQEEFKKLGIKANGSYTWLPDGCQMVADCPPQNRIEENNINQDNNKGGVGENYSYEKNSNINNFLHCLETHKENEYINSNPDLMNCLKDWFEYKDSKKPKANNHYGTKLGMDKLIKKVVDKCKEYGVQAVVETINDTIANNYQGIVWNWLEKKRGNYGNTKPERRNARTDDVEIDPYREEILAFWREQQGMQ